MIPKVPRSGFYTVITMLFAMSSHVSLGGFLERWGYLLGSLLVTLAAKCPHEASKMVSWRILGAAAGVDISGAGGGTGQGKPPELRHQGG